MLVLADNRQVRAVSPLFIRNVLAGGPNSLTRVSAFLPIKGRPKFCATCSCVAAKPHKTVAAKTAAIVGNTRITPPPRRVPTAQRYSASARRGCATLKCAGIDLQGRMLGEG